MGLVYSTEKGRICPRCEYPVANCQCKTGHAKASAPTPGDGWVRLQRQTQGRGGKVVTTITGIDLPNEELKQLAKRLKQLCGSGGSLNESAIEIQGDHRTRLKAELEHLGYRVKLAGGQ